MLAGFSVDYYTRLERGNLNGASESVLDGVARGLQFDEAERAHLFNLSQTAGTTPRTRRRTGPQAARPSVQRLLDAMTGAPAYLRNGRLDILATNQLGRALYSEVLTERVRPPNPARFAFLNPRAASCPGLPKSEASKGEQLHRVPLRGSTRHECAW